MREMKDSGTVWRKVPLNWNLVRIDSLYVLRNEKVSDRDYQPLSVTKQGILPQLETAAKTDAHDSRKLVKKGDFAINSRSDRRGSCGISELDGSVSLINTVLKPRSNMNPRYYNWLFHTNEFGDEFYKWGHGIVDDLWTTNWQDMKVINIPQPPIKEQKAIADFLDKKCSEIDALTKNIEKQKEVLEDYKKSVITAAVTKGLNPNVEMKDSGLNWSALIPKNWKVNRIKYIFESKKGLPITKEHLIESGLPVISYGQIHSKDNKSTMITESLKRFVSFDYQLLFPKCNVHINDFIFADTSEDYAGCGNFIYKRDTSLLYAGYHSIILSSIANQDNRYFAYLFLTDCWRKQIRERASGVKVFSITQSNINNVFVIVPPMKEQIIISNYLDDVCNEVDTIIVNKKRQLEILAQYKKSMIFEYVTGKKEVIV